MSKLIITAAIAAVSTVAAVAVSEKLRIVNYDIYSKKIKSTVKLALVSDLHSSLYGAGQHKITKALQSACPDAILFAGDIADDRKPNDNAMTLAASLGSKFRCFYVTGNHEFYTGETGRLKQIFRAYGLTVLEGSRAELFVGENKISFFGIDDPFGQPDQYGRMWEDQLSDCCRLCESDSESYSVLLSHRPEPVRDYAETPFDLILSGHAHGGQLRIPGVLNGLYAPHQGLFPKYAGGMYELSPEQKMIVSRGLSKYIRPRVFNRPELVLINLKPYIN